MLMPQFSLFLSFRHTEQKEKRAGERMTQSFRKAAMSVNMSHNRDMFTDTLPSPKRDTQMAPLSTLLHRIAAVFISDGYQKYQAYLA